MTITIAWIRRQKSTTEMVVASDSRLRSYGAMDQAQKIFRLQRGDCCLAFCGDAQVAYPFFIQVGSALDNYIKTRTRAEDTIQLGGTVGKLLNNLIDAWDIKDSEKEEQLATTRILFAGWSWVQKRFDIGFFRWENGAFRFYHDMAKVPHPWHEKKRSIVFIGDYEKDYFSALRSILDSRYPKGDDANQKIKLDFNYEPLEALNNLLAQQNPEHHAIGGAPQLVKVYPYGNSLPFVVRTRAFPAQIASYPAAAK